MIFDALGRCIVSRSDGLSLEFVMPMAGAYLWKKQPFVFPMKTSEGQTVTAFL
jgi:hypothetical protein